MTNNINTITTCKMLIIPNNDTATIIIIIIIINIIIHSIEFIRNNVQIIKVLYIHCHTITIHVLTIIHQLIIDVHVL